MNAAQLLIRAYANGEAGEHVDWSDVDLAFEQAKAEHPGEYEAILAELAEGDPLCACQDCEWEGRESELDTPIKDIHQRVNPGEPMPAGECPECGALAHVKEPNL